MNIYDNMDYVRTICADIVTATPPPYRSVKWKLAPDPDGDPCLYLFLYLDNFAAHSTEQQTSIGEWAGAIITKIRTAGIPCYLARIKES